MKNFNPKIYLINQSIIKIFLKAYPLKNKSLIKTDYKSKQFNSKHKIKLFS